MAVRVRLGITGARGRRVETIAVLNGGFEVPAPHLLLPAACAQVLFPKYRRMAVREEMSAAGGPVEFLALTCTVRARVRTPDRQGPWAEFRVLVSDADREALISDGGIDALGIEVKSFVPGRWRFKGERRSRPTAAPQWW